MFLHFLAPSPRPRRSLTSAQFQARGSSKRPYPPTDSCGSGFRPSSLLGDLIPGKVLRVEFSSSVIAPPGDGSAGSARAPTILNGGVRGKEEREEQKGERQEWEG